MVDPQAAQFGQEVSPVDCNLAVGGVHTSGNCTVGSPPNPTSVADPATPDTDVALVLQDRAGGAACGPPNGAAEIGLAAPAGECRLNSCMSWTLMSYL